MPEEKEDSNSYNNSSNIDRFIDQKTEDKNSSTKRTNESNPLLDDSRNDAAVEEIVRRESDELLALHTESSPVKSGKRWRNIVKQKKVFIPAIILSVAILLMVIPFTRYKVLGLFLQEKYTVLLTDSQTGNPVSGAELLLNGQKTTTNSEGQATFKMRVGNVVLSISKKYYKSDTTMVFVPIHQKNPLKVKLQPTGRQVPVKVVNAINHQPVGNAKISAEGTTSVTNKQGQATIVLAASQSQASATVQTSGYNDLAVKLTITDKQVSANTFSQTPSGRIYFLSNLSGSIDVVSTNLDGSGRQTVLAGTGNEDPSNTYMLATHDWQYLALLSKRDGGSDAKLFLINTSTKQVTTIDNSPASFNPVGWVGHTFVYQTTPDNMVPWQSGDTQIKSYDADNGHSATIDQSTATGSQYSYVSESIDFVKLVEGHVVYGLAWTSLYDPTGLNGKSDSIFSANPDGSNKQNLRNINLPDNTQYTYMSAAMASPQSLDIQISFGQPSSTYFVYQATNNTVSQDNNLNDSTYNQVQTESYSFLMSPNGNQTFWAEQRDGKNTLLIGDASGNNAQQIAALSDYVPYGWYGQEYLLVEKGGNELYVMPVSGGQTLKISDYYKAPRYSFTDSGGYGGL